MVIKRSYQTIFDTLGNIGGTSGIVSILIMLVFSPLYEYLEGKYLLQITLSARGKRDDRAIGSALPRQCSTEAR